MRLLSVLLALLLAIAPVHAASPSIPPGAPVLDVTGKTVTPTGGSQPVAVGDALSATRFLVPRSYRAAWKPFPGSTSSQDTSGGFNGRTLTAAFEVPSDFIAARIWFANSSATLTPTLSGCLVAASSEWGTSGYGGATPGITPYDSLGNAMTSMTSCSFGNNGALTVGDTFGIPSTAVPANAYSGTLSASTAQYSNILTFSSVPANVGAGQTVVAPVGTASGPYLNPLTTVSAVTATTVSLSSGSRVAIPSGATIYFLPQGMTLPATTAPPLPAIVATDWMPLTSIQRIDGPVAVGNTLLDASGTSVPSNDTVTAVGTKTVTISAALTNGYPANSPVKFCQALPATNAAATPITTLTFSSVTNLSVGMQAYMQGSPFDGGGAQSAQQGSIPVTAVNNGNGTVTLQSPIGPNLGGISPTYNSGWPVVFDLPGTITAPVSSGATTVTVASTAGLSVGMSVKTTGISASIASIVDGTHYTINTAASQAVPSGIGVHHLLTQTLSAAVTSGTQLSFASSIPGAPISIAGDQVVGTGIPAGTLAWGIAGTSVNLTQSVTSTIASGTNGLQICKTMTTAAASPAGSSTLNFAQTTYPNKLFLTRLRFSGTPTNAPYYAIQNNYEAQWNAFGLPAFTGATCGNDGIAAVTNISNTGGGCFRLDWFPEYLIEFIAPKRGITALVTGDSHFAGDTSVTNAADLLHRGLAPLSTPALPVSIVNAAWSGQPSYIWGNLAEQIIPVLKPDVAVVAGGTWNDIFGTPGNTQMLSTIHGLARQVQGYGGLPVIVSEYQRQVYGCNASSSVGETYRQQVLAYEQAQVSNGVPFLDASALLADPTNGSTFINPAYSTDCIHANDAGHLAIGTALRNLIRPNLGN